MQRRVYHNFFVRNLSTRVFHSSSFLNNSKDYVKNQDVIQTLTNEPEAEDPNSSWFIDPDFIQKDISLQKELTRKDGSDLNVPKWIQNMKSKENNNESHFLMNGKVELNVENIVSYLVSHLKAQNVSVIDMRDKCSWTNYMVVTEGISTSHISRLSEGFYQMIKKRNAAIQTQVGKTNSEKDSSVNSVAKDEELTSNISNDPIPLSQVRIEGKDSPDWHLVDLGNIVVHFFTKESRNAYNLESLWENRKIEEINEEIK